jgi:hypothetical protein
VPVVAGGPGAQPYAFACVHRGVDVSWRITFWLALAVVGEIQRARDMMERLLRVASPLGPYAEEFDAGTRRFLGNFPQAFPPRAYRGGRPDHPCRAIGGFRLAGQLMTTGYDDE